jgi:putative aldouronate transport system permease protein
MKKTGIKRIDNEPGYQIQSKGQKIFGIVNIIILSILALTCILPFMHIFAQSLSSNAAIAAKMVNFLPVELTFENYQYALNRAPFWNSLFITMQRVAIGLPINLFLVITSAYPLSKMKGKFNSRVIYVWFFFFTMLFNGGMIPTYLLINRLGLRNSIWALILPNSANVFNMLLMLSFFRQLSSELEDAANVDGAGHWRTLWQIFVPISVPVIATVTIFSLVNHWNSWFDGLIYMKPERYPLQTYLRSIIINFSFSNLSPEEQKRLAEMNDRALKSAQMILGAIPILVVYPFLQRYFVSGITLGSVKG